MHLHLHLAHFVSADPKSARLRKRQQRKMRPVRPNHRNELWYRTALLWEVVGPLRVAGHEIAAELASSWPRVKDETAKEREEIERKRAEATKRTAGVALRLSVDATQRNLKAVDERLSASVEASTGANIRAALTLHGPIADEMQAATEANVALITSIPEQYFDQLDDLVSEGWTAGIRHEDLIEEIEHLGDVTESRAALIARDQTSKMNSAFNRVRQVSIGIEKYEWQTAGDERVRESHAELDGQTFAWDDPPTVDDEPANPGEPINCRCVGAPVIDLDEGEAAPEDDDEGDDDLDEAVAA